MANNCLVTKLKESVNNDSLVKLGYLKAEINGALLFNCTFPIACTVKFYGMTVDGQSTFNLEANQRLTITNRNTIVKTEEHAYIEFPKYGIIDPLSTSGIDINFEDLKYAKLPTGFGIGS